MDTGSNCSCTNYTLGPGCVDSGGSCSCSGSGLDRQCEGSGCTDSDGTGTACVRTKICTGGGCNDSDGGGSGCIAGKLCRGIGCEDSGANCSCNNMVSTNTATSEQFRCCDSLYLGGPVTCQYPAGGGRDGSCVDCVVDDIYSQTALRDKDYTWFWDQNANWTGNTGVRGTVVVKQDFRLSSGGDDKYCQQFAGGCTVRVPPQAWREYQKYDTTSATSQYPGDMPNRKSSSSVTYSFGSNYTNNTCSTSLDNDGGLSLITRGELWRVKCNALGLGADLGIYGFLYVGGNLERYGSSDIYGAMWVEGSVSGSDNTMVFYNSNLQLPTLNVVLQRESWNETKPAVSAWP